jgi:hypothetical protein
MKTRLFVTVISREATVIGMEPAYYTATIFGGTLSNQISIELLHKFCNFQKLYYDKLDSIN